jgi:NAD(P)H dehydrogenase (quinone)
MNFMNTYAHKPTVLVLGSTGQVGQLVVKELANNQDVNVRVTSRRKADVERLRAKGKDVVYLDLDDPKTFGLALAGVDRAFLLTGYTVAMLFQSKTFVDAAKKAGVEHIVHLGIFADWDCTDPHFAWHQLVERYIEASGIAWTHLHPNMFLENLLSFFAPKGDVLTVFWERQRMGWIAAADIAAVAAKVLTEGPRKHHRQNYWMSTEALDGPEVAAILSDVTGRDIKCDIQGADDFKALFQSSNIQVESWYAEGGVEFMRQVIDGRMGNISSVRDDVPYILGRPALTVRVWASQHRDELIAAAKSA